MAFESEKMICLYCSAQQVYDPKISSGWVAVIDHDSDQRTYYICPEHIHKRSTGELVDGFIEGWEKVNSQMGKDGNWELIIDRGSKGGRFFHKAQITNQPDSRLE